MIKVSELIKFLTDTMNETGDIEVVSAVYEPKKERYHICDFAGAFMAETKNTTKVIAFVGAGEVEIEDSEALGEEIKKH